MGEPIKIVVTAETAEAAAKLQDFLQQSGSGMTGALKEVSKHASAASGSLGNARLGMMELGHVGRSMADGLMAGISPLRMMAMESPRIVQSLGELGIKLSTLLPYVGAVAAAAAVLGAEWYFVMGGVEDSTKATETFLAAMEKVPALLEKIHGLQKAGIISPAAAKEFANELANNPKKYRRSDGTITTEQFSEEEIIPDGPAQLNPPDHGWRKRRVENTPMTQADIMAETDKKLPQVSKEQTAALAKLGELQTVASNDFLFGVAKEKAAIEEKNKKIIETIEATAKLAGMPLTKDGVRNAGVDAKAAAMVAEVRANQQRQFAELDKAAAEKMAREQEISVGKIRAAEKGDVSERLKALEDGLTEKQNVEGVLRGQLSGAEFQDRKHLAESFYFSGEIEEAEYTHLLQEAAKKRTQGEKEYRSELEKIAQLKQEIARADAEAKIRSIEKDPLLTNQQKDAQLTPLYQAQQAGNAAEIASLNVRHAATADLAAQLEIEKKIFDLKLQQVELQTKINAAQNAGSFRAQLSEMIVQLQNVGTLAQQTAHIFEGVFHTAVSSISQGITGLIMGTKTWGQALRDVYNSIATEIVQAIVHAVVQMVLLAAITRLAKAAGLDTGGGKPDPATEVEWGAAAMLRSIADLGPIAGPVAFFAEVGTAAAFGGAFADGGRPPTGRYSLVGERGPELFVPDSAGTILPADQTAALMSGGGGGSKVSVYSYMDPRAMQDHIERNDDHEKYILDVLGKNLHRIRA